MAKTRLVEALIQDGATLLHQLDDRHFPVTAMSWSFLADDNYWRVKIVSAIVSEKGGRAAYEQLNNALSRISLAGLTLEDISVFEPGSRGAASVQQVASGSNRLAAGAEWVEYDDAVVYRWNDVSLTAELDRDIPADALKRLWDAEGKLVNLPSLLFHSEHRLVTMRPHPKHGPVDGLEGVRKSFQIALHREFADCHVKWLTELHSLAS